MNHADDTSSIAPASPWHVLGAGAIGGLWALRLAARGLPVHLLAHGDTAPQRRLTLQDGERQQTEIFTQCDAYSCGPIAQLLVTTKAHATAPALEPLLSRLNRGMPVLLLQNGMGVDDWLCRERPDLRVLTAITTDGVFRRDRDTLVLAGQGETLLGAMRAQDNDSALRIAAELGMTFAPDIRQRRWLKLAMNCAINPLTARYRCRNGELLHNAEALACMREVCAEIACVMTAEGLPAEADMLYRLACDTAAKTAGNISSMRADVDAGRETEIRFLNGYVLGRAQAHALPAPMNAALAQEILALR